MIKTLLIGLSALLFLASGSAWAGAYSSNYYSESGNIIQISFNKFLNPNSGSQFSVEHTYDSPTTNGLIVFTVGNRGFSCSVSMESPLFETATRVKWSLENGAVLTLVKQGEDCVQIRLSKDSEYML